MKSMLFHRALVPAVLDGRKRRTRRLLVAPPWATSEDVVRAHQEGHAHIGHMRDGRPVRRASIQPYEVGERVYLREPWRPRWAPDGAVVVDYQLCPETRTVPAAAREGWRWPAAAHRGEGWCSPLIMPVFAARAEMLIDLVRVERLQDITEDEARLEGLPFKVEPAMAEWNALTGDTDPPGVWVGPPRLRRLTRGPRLTEEVVHHNTARAAFADWWDALAEEADRRRPRDRSTGEPEGAPAPRWADNPWVFVYGFTCSRRTP